MPFSAKELWKETERELAQRRRVYPRLIAQEKMTTAQAHRQIAMMEVIRDDYREKAKTEEGQGQLKI